MRTQGTATQRSGRRQDVKSSSRLHLDLCVAVAEGPMVVMNRPLVMISGQEEVVGLSRMISGQEDVERTTEIISVGPSTA